MTQCSKVNSLMFEEVPDLTIPQHHTVFMAFKALVTHDPENMDDVQADTSEKLICDLRVVCCVCESDPHHTSGWNMSQALAFKQSVRWRGPYLTIMRSSDSCRQLREGRDALSHLPPSGACQKPELHARPSFGPVADMRLLFSPSVAVTATCLSSFHYS